MDKRKHQTQYQMERTKTFQPVVASNISGNIGKSERNHAEKPCLVQSLSSFSMAGFREWCSWRIFKTYLKESSWPCLAIWQMAAVFIIQPPTEWPGSALLVDFHLCQPEVGLYHHQTPSLMSCSHHTSCTGLTWTSRKKCSNRFPLQIHWYTKIFTQLTVVLEACIGWNCYTVFSEVAWACIGKKKSCKTLGYFSILCKENHWMKTIIFENKHQTDKIVMKQDCHGILASW